MTSARPVETVRPLPIIRDYVKSAHFVRLDLAGFESAGNARQLRMATRGSSLSPSLSLANRFGPAPVCVFDQGLNPPRVSKSKGNSFTEPRFAFPPNSVCGIAPVSPPRRRPARGSYARRFPWSSGSTRGPGARSPPAGAPPRPTSRIRACVAASAGLYRSVQGMYPN